MKIHRATFARYTSVIVAALSFIAATEVSAHTWQVASYGVDSGSCGSPKSPCRSISQAIENANAGDTIMVGPGRYGDVNGDGNYTGPGDEHPDPNAGSHWGPIPLGCIVCISKPLHIYSTQGAATTVIATDPQSPFGSTVMIESAGVDFGALGQGFTLMGGSPYGVLISVFFPVLENISIGGNIDQGDATGFSFYGYAGDECSDAPAGFCVYNARVLIAHNQALGNRTGFYVAINHSLAGPIQLESNVASGGGTGFQVDLLSGGVSLRGPWVPGAGQVQMTNNVAVGNSVGFSTAPMGPIEHNAAVANSVVGFAVVPGGASFNGNSAIGNAGPGAVVTLYKVDNPEGFPDPISSAFSSFEGNNFINNDRNRPAPGPSAHCGVLIGIFLPPGYPFQPPPPALMQLEAQNNYWGAARGPSSSGAADAVDGACEQDGASTVAKPFSSVPFPVTP